MMLFSDPVPSEEDFDKSEVYIDLSGSFAFSHTPDMKQASIIIEGRGIIQGIDTMSVFLQSLRYLPAKKESV